MVESVIIDESTRKDATRLISEHWCNPIIVSRGKIHSADTLPGFLAVENNHIKGLITYNIEDDDCEILCLISLQENQGIGSMLLELVIKEANYLGCKKVWLVTTNDNTHAIRFYQKRGFKLSAIHINAIHESRILKPQIPLLGIDDIPILHEIVFEKAL